MATWPIGFPGALSADDIGESVLAAVRDAMYGWTAERLVASQTALGLPAYLYLFDHAYPAAGRCRVAGISRQRNPLCVRHDRPHAAAVAESSVEHGPESRSLRRHGRITGPRLPARPAADGDRPCRWHRLFTAAARTCISPKLRARDGGPSPACMNCTRRWCDAGAGLPATWHGTGMSALPRRPEPGGATSGAAMVTAGKGALTHDGSESSASCATRHGSHPGRASARQRGRAPSRRSSKSLVAKSPRRPSSAPR